MTVRARIVGGIAACSALVLLAACGTDDGPGPGEATNSPDTSTSTGKSGASPSADEGASAQEVRRALGALDPCGLLTPGSGPTFDIPLAEGPHTCDGEVDGERYTVEVGAPFDAAARDAAEAHDIAGLRAYREADLCRVVFAAGESHGIGVRGACGTLDRAAQIVGAALTRGLAEVTRDAGPDNLTACDLLAGAVDDPATLVDAQGDTTGLDHCEGDGPSVSARDSLRLLYNESPFDRLAQTLGAKAGTVTGRDVAVVDEGEYGCFVHTYLWRGEAEGVNPANAEATVFGSDCDRARELTAGVIEAADAGPTDPTTAVSELLVRAD